MCVHMMRIIFIGFCGHLITLLGSVLVSLC